MKGINLYTLRFGDGTETEATAQSSWYPRPIGTPMVNDPEYDAKMFREVGRPHPTWVEAHSMTLVSEADYAAACEPVEVVGVRTLEF